MEKDMFPILKNHLEKQGFNVKAEVLKADIVAVKEDLVIVIEMKTKLNTKLIYQGLKRSHISDYVYLAILKPTEKILHSDNFKQKKMIVRRLELGLIIVDIDTLQVEILLDPKTYHFKRNKKKKRALLKEFNLRKTKVNVGGTTKTKIITAYRELALLALIHLQDGPKTTQSLRQYTKRKKVVRLLQDNYYGWFERVERGTYQLTPKGNEAFITYKAIIATLKDLR